MSIQQHREVIAANGGKAVAFDPDFFNSIEDRYQKLKAKASHPADFRRLSAEVRKYGADLANREDWNTEEHRPVYDAILAWASVIDIEIENLAAVQDLGGAMGAPSEQGAWRNAKTGEPIRLLAQADAFNDGPKPEVGIGEVLQGMFFGAKSDAVRNALESGTDTAGGYTVPLEIARDFIDKLREASTFIAAGAQTMPLDGPTRIVRLDEDPTATWRAENDSIGDSNIVLSALDLTPKSLSTLVKVPYELLADSVNIAAILQRALLQALSVELDRAALFGDGTGNTPLGLFNTAGINEVSMGDDGATPADYDDLVDMLFELENDNVPSPTAAIWSPRTVRSYRKMKDSQGQPLNAPAPIPDLRKLSTTAVPDDLDQGTSTGVCSTVLMGDFSDAILGMREELTIIRLDQTFAANGQIGFWARLRADVGFAHPESFCRLVGVTA